MPSLDPKTPIRIGWAYAPGYGSWNKKIHKRWRGVLRQGTSRVLWSCEHEHLISHGYGPSSAQYCAMQELRRRKAQGGG